MIIVRAIDHTKAVFARVRRDAQKLGDDIGHTITSRANQRIEHEAQSGSGGYAHVGDVIGETIGRRVAERVTVRVREAVDRSAGGGSSASERARAQARGSDGRFTSGARSDSGGNGRDREHVTVKVDVDKKSFLASLLGAAKTAGEKVQGAVQTGLQGAFSAVFSGDSLGQLIKVGVLGVLVATLAPALGAAIAAAILLALGGGAIGAGIAAAFKDPNIMAAAKDLWSRFGDLGDQYGRHFKGPIANFLEGMLGVLDQVTPLIDHLGATFGPVADLLGQGLIGFLQNALPGILRAAEAAAPVWAELAESLPKLGDDIGRFFDRIKNSGPEAAQFVNDFIAALGLLIRALGWVIETLANLYSVARRIFTGIVDLALTLFSAIADGAAAAFGWVPGLGPKLQHAATEVAKFKDKVNNELAAIHDKQITVSIKQVFSTVGQVVGDIGKMIGAKASGGIQGAASGGPRGGLTWVGEHGPELMNVAPGSQVHSAGDSQRMNGSGRGSNQPLIIQLVMDAKVIARAMIDPQREIVRNEYGGSVEAALGFSRGR